jgi:cysteine-rich repeat protein
MKPARGIRTVVAVFALLAAAAGAHALTATPTRTRTPTPTPTPSSPVFLQDDFVVTTAGCGDGVLQPERGEECDDGNHSDGDCCSSSCRLPVGILAGPVVNPANGHRYYLLQAASWPDSEAQAVCLGGHLVTINNEAEDSWMLETFSHYGGVERSLWVGLSDAISEGTWLWSSGEPVTYTHWCSGEPNESIGGEDYAATWEHPVCWNDEGEAAVFNFGVVELTDCGNGVLDAGEECDDGNTNSFDGCANWCTVCGNGAVRSPEQCDDGNRIDSDACTADCRLPAVAVGTGTAESCTEAELDLALASGERVTFDCGPVPVTITLTSEKVIWGKTTVDGGGLVTLSGGGVVRIFRVEPGATLNALNLIIADGKADYGGGFLNDYGGGILNNQGTLALTNCTLSGNSADGAGGGIANSGIATLTNCTLSENAGGGIYNEGTVTLTNCTLSESAIEVTRDGVATLTNCTLIESAIDNYYPCGCCGAEQWCTTPVTISNSIIAGSTGPNCAVPIIDGGNNLQWPGTPCGGAIPSLDPLLDPAGLADNGGPTQTIALQPGSPAIDAGDPEACAGPPVNGVDQRGYARPGTGSANCSIGAYEYDSPGPPAGCLGDCDDSGEVTVDELITLVNIALGTTDMAECDAGDADSDGEVTVDELVRAVHAALVGCPISPAEQACIDSGGTIGSATCCLSAGDFPDTCAIGACGCPPDGSHEVAVCDCGAGWCFDGVQCVEE